MKEMSFLGKPSLQRCCERSFCLYCSTKKMLFGTFTNHAGITMIMKLCNLCSPCHPECMMSLITMFWLSSRNHPAVHGMFSFFKYLGPPSFCKPPGAWNTTSVLWVRINHETDLRERYGLRNISTGANLSNVPLEHYSDTLRLLEPRQFSPCALHNETLESWIM